MAAQATWPRTALAAIESWLEEERDRIGLWLPVAFAAGIACWMLLPDERAYGGALIACAGLAGIGSVIGLRTRLGRMLAIGAVAAAAGLGLIWWKSLSVAAPVLERPVITRFSGTIEQTEWRVAQQQTRLMIAVDPGQGLPPRVRVSVRDNLATPSSMQWQKGQKLSIRARLMPPPAAALPGGYDFAMRAWFDGIGAVGTALESPRVEGVVSDSAPLLRDRLAAHIRDQLAASEAGIAVALATGDQGGIAAEDAEAMQNSGLAHLLSVSGLHVTAVVGATMLLVLRLLALSPYLAVRLPLVLVAAAAGALAAIGYTWLTGAQVPTVRSCIAALLVLLALSLGREAITMRLLATGALIVLVVQPQALFGPSFQLSFAAIAAIMAVHEHPVLKRFTMRRDEGWMRRTGRSMAALLLTGLAVELALMPIAMFHFHKAGVYGALANMVAIPLTTFVIMPLEALALLLDLAGLGAPLWWLCEQALALLLWLAHVVAAMPGAVTLVPGMQGPAFGLIIAGGLWLLLWQQWPRLLGLLPVLAGLVLVLTSGPPDLLITNDGRHVATRLPDGRYAMLRTRAGDFMRDMMAEATGMEDDMLRLDSLAAARCNADFCSWTIAAQPRPLHILASRSAERAPWQSVVAACARADIVISDRWMPRACTPRMLLVDGKYLDKNGGLALYLAQGRIDATLARHARKPWRTAERMAPARPLRSNARPAPSAQNASMIAAQ